MTESQADRQAPGDARAAEAREETARDAACIARYRAGITAAFDEVAARYGNRIFTHLVRMTGSREDAEDLTQETFVRALRHLPAYDAERPFRSWLYAIATNVGVDHVRKAQRRARLAPVAEDCAPVAPDTPNPAHHERDARLRDAVKRLPARAAALVHLHYFEGMSLKEAGAVLAMEEGAAKVALHRARKRLRELLLEES